MGRKRATEVTLVCVAGVQVLRALVAIMKSARQIRFDRIVLVTTKLKPVQWGKFSVQEPIESKLDSLIEYNKYVLYKLYHHVHTRFCLVIQADGYVINGNLWNEKFYEYDYIGAPWPVKSDAYIDPFGNHQRVGNGGFSLRSRRLLTVPQKIEIPWNVNEGNFYRHFNKNSYSEDGNICVHNRHLFEQEGCKFASLDIACQFSHELDLTDVVIGKTFGFHRYKSSNVFLKAFKRGSINTISKIGTIVKSL
jgi:hypothetical protein